MTKIKIKKIVTGILLFLLSSSSLFFARAAQAQLFGLPQAVYLVDPATTATLNAIAGSTAATAGSASAIVGTSAATAGSTAATVAALGVLNATVGVPGVTQGVVAGILTGSKAVGTACSGIQKFQDIAGTADNFSSFSFIGGSPTEALQITTKLAALIAVKTCDEAQLLVISTTPAPSVLAAQELTRRQQTLSNEIVQLGVRIENLKARQSMTFKDVLKAIAIKLLLTYSQKLTTRVINSLILKFGITNYLKYADAVATVVYTTDYVNKNYPDNADKLILRSILNNQVVQGTISPIIRSKAQKFLGFDPTQIVITDPNYYAKMALVGSASANPYFLQNYYNSQAAIAKAQGDNSAQQEIGTGKGYIPVRNCAGAVNQQVTNDQKLLTAAKQWDFNNDVLLKLQDAYKVNPTPQAKSQLDIAQAALNKSDAAVDKLPEDVDKPFVEICQAISNPGAFVGNSIESYLQNKLAQGMNLNNNNLPFYGQFMQSLATDLINNVLLGGKSAAQILTQSGIAAATIGASNVVEQWDQNKAQNSISESIVNQTNPLGGASKDGINFEAAPLANSTSQFQLLWDASGYTGSNAGFVTVAGGTLPGTTAIVAQPLTGKLNANYPAIIASAGSSTYTLNLYATGAVPGRDQPLDQLTMTVSPPSSTSNSNSGGVFGAFVTKVPLNTRGPVQALSVR